MNRAGARNTLGGPTDHSQTHQLCPHVMQDIYGVVKGGLSIGQRQRFEEMCQLIERSVSKSVMWICVLMN